LGAVQHCVDYWTLSMDQDASDFKMEESAQTLVNESSARGCRRRLMDTLNTAAATEEGVGVMAQQPCEAERLEGFVACEQRGTPPPGGEQEIMTASGPASGGFLPERPGNGLWPRDG